MRIGALSGSLTKLNDGSSYIVAGSNITVTSSSNGNVTISSTASGGGDVGAAYLVLSATGSLTNERAFLPGTGLNGIDAGAGDNYTLSINDSIVATISGAQFNGNVGVTGSLGVSTLTALSGVLYQAGGRIQQDSNFVWDADNDRLGIGTSQPAKPLHVGPTVGSAIRIGPNNSYVELNQHSGAPGAGVYKWVGGGVVQIEQNVNQVYPGSVKVGFNSTNAATIDAAFSRAAAGIINVSGSAPGAIFRFNAASSPLAAGDLGMNTSTGRPNAYIGGTVQALAHINEIAPSTSSYVVMALDGTLTNERVLTAGTGLTLTDNGAGNNATFAINNSVVATVSGTNFAGQVGLTSVKEKLNILSGATGTVTHNCSTGYIFYHSAPLANFTANFTNFTSSIGNGFATSMTLIVSQSSPAYLPTAVQLDGNAQTINWLNSNTPIGNANKKDIVSFSVMGISSSYVVLGQLATFG